MKDAGMRMRLLLAALTTFGGAALAADCEQTVSFGVGWNAVYVEVAPKVSADALFADWPVQYVSLYDAAAFLDTKQYSAEDSNEGTVRNVMRTWHRDNPGASGFAAVPADSVLLFKASAAGTRTIVGEPRAPRITWHLSSADEPKNYVGLSTWGETTVADYFSGAAIDLATCTRLYGTGDAPQQGAVFATEKLRDGQALAVDAKKVGDWSGVLRVSPRDGIDFGVEGSQTSLSVRNDGATARTVEVSLAHAKGDALVAPQGLFARDRIAALTNGAWCAFSTSAEHVRRKRLAAGETWELQLALDRLQLAGPSGTVYGALLDIRDADGGSKMRVRMPLTATGDGGASSEYAWPKGIWLGVAELDRVSFFLTKAGDSTGRTDGVGMKKAGGRMRVRLPLYVDESGKMTLLQRFWYGRDTNGVLRAYSGAVETSDVPLVDVKRVSSASLPTDQPEIPFPQEDVIFYRTVEVTNQVVTTVDVGEVAGKRMTYVVTNEVTETKTVVDRVVSNRFGTSAVTTFTVGENSNVNPMRHAPHPRHDGLKADYLGPTPSGDDLSNYSGTLKPEAFSVTNRLELTWDESAATAWNPAETLSGTIKWEFGGIRHEGPIQAEGRFSMKRLSPVTMKMK